MSNVKNATSQDITDTGRRTRTKTNRYSLRIQNGTLVREGEQEYNNDPTPICELNMNRRNQDVIV